MPCAHPNPCPGRAHRARRSEEHTSELQSHHDLVCRLLLEKKKKKINHVSIKISKKENRNDSFIINIVFYNTENCIDVNKLNYLTYYEEFLTVYASYIYTTQ